MNDELQALREEIYAQKQLSLALAYSYRILARELSKSGHIDLQILQAMMRRAVEELERNADVDDQVAFQLENMADDVLYDFFYLQHKDGQNRDPSHPWYKPDLSE
ncbi:hypothetical protein [Gynuella sp.]|uniref:hypothetical protein n=1 Tax=Gynuella sp. TaxID=2969146 RepID=UPI003D10E8B1